jgi:hypothetical protein
MLSRIGKLCGGTVAAATVVLALAPVAPAASLPKAVDFWGMRPDALATRPAALGWTTDLGPSFNGTPGSNTGRGPDSNLSWSTWSANGANGNGDLWVRLCQLIDILRTLVYDPALKSQGACQAGHFPGALR